MQKHRLATLRVDALVHLKITPTDLINPAHIVAFNLSLNILILFHNTIKYEICWWYKNSRCDNTGTKT